MSDKEIKIRRHVTTTEVVDFFRAFADKLNQQEPENRLLSDLEVANFSKIKISLKKEDEQISLKLNIKPAGKSDVQAVSSDAAMGNLKYKTLKKRMKSCFREITRDLHNRVLPSEKAVNMFLRDSELMTTYPEDGAIYFNRYIKACREFRDAYAKRDILLCQKKCNALNRIKNECHRAFK